MKRKSGGFARERRERKVFEKERESTVSRMNINLILTVFLVSFFSHIRSFFTVEEKKREGEDDRETLFFTRNNTAYTTIRGGSSG